MIIKKFQATTEKDAIMLAKDDLGKDAIVMNIKTIAPKGLARLFKKPSVEITAAVDDSLPIKNNTSFASVNSYSSIQMNSMPKTNDLFSEKNLKDNTIFEKEKKQFNYGFQNGESYFNDKETAIEEKLNNLQELLEQQMKEKEITQQENAKKEEVRNEYLELVFKQLVQNEVDEEYANQIINEVEGSVSNALSVDQVLSSVYQKLVLKLGQANEIALEGKKPNFVFFIGPTGVGKTTTIAKIASTLKMNENAKVALLTSDTYRIAAVEQLRIYANILSVPIKVIYTADEMLEAKEEFADYDVILVDTAGRSHKNVEQRNDLLTLLDTVEEENKEIYLVLSATTKYKDLLKIMASYSEVNDFNLIFTKLDETSCIGNILNIKMATNASLSYATWGQNVPDDIGKIDAQNIAKQLLGGND
ncbi:flagellar biosynthesis protein FlhF [Anaeromicropila herbilytica]|uniref:Flagellar biosynthesis protein FlhF n=1 Tax=Anaeromicropila herbilytica TaxID=2785025 RepID=A0A7R7EMC2_9FIRM|nr:flagellar biosynthesis protein FlhF [Anaeromicropila herbilytica]BCN31515.1 flagellar biosynthesis regulator FlhF [Anaeromicropila herbilytica]